MAPIVYVVKRTARLGEHEFQFLLQFAGSEHRARIEKISHCQRAEQSVIGQALIRYLLSVYYGIRPEQAVFAAGRRGKPYLAGYPHIHFNISHSGLYVAAALHSRPVGIDLQRITPYRPKIAQRFFSTAEVAWVEAQDDRDAAFTRVWTQKESLVKLTGQGLSALRALTEYPVVTKTWRLADCFLTLCTEALEK